MTIAAERLLGVGAELGEGPVWHPEREVVVWVDILRGEVHVCTLDGTDHVEQAHPEPVGAVALTAAGEIVVATPRGLCRADGSVVAAIPSERDDLRMNDGKPDPVGRFIGGTMTVGDAMPGVGSLWSLDGSGPARRLVGGVTIPNGLAWDAGGERLYWIDTPTGRIDVFDYDPATGTIADRRPHLGIDPADGAPDGMCIDADGGLWVALWGGGAVRRYVDGRCEEIVEVPTPLVTCPTFAGPDLDRLVVTTASVDFAEPPPGAGDLYLAEVDVVGCPPARLGAWAR